MSSKNFMAYDDAVSVLTEYASDIKGKTDKVASATADDFATLDSNGNLTDSGISKAVVPSGATSSNKLEIESSFETLSRFGGIKMHLGKGAIKPETVQMLAENNAVFAIIPPVTALLESQTLERECVAWPELGMEAL